MAYFDNQNENSWLGQDGNSVRNMYIAGGISAYFSKTYGWMALALVLSGLAAWLTGHNFAFQQMFLTGYSPMILMFAELGLVFAISGAINRLSAAACTVLFVIFAIVNGLTLGVIFLKYTDASIASTFGVSALVFGSMSLYGFTTKSDLSSLGKILFFGLIGIIIATLVNLFLGSSMLQTIISVIGVVVFVGLTAYDTQKIKALAIHAVDEESSTKLAVCAALTLYLDFINLFLYLLRFLGNRRD